MNNDDSMVAQSAVPNQAAATDFAGSQTPDERLKSQKATGGEPLSSEPIKSPTVLTTSRSS